MKVVNEPDPDVLLIVEELAELGYLLLPVRRVIPESLRRKADAEREPDANDPRWRVVALRPLAAATADKATVKRWWGRWPDADIGVVYLITPWTPAVEKILRRRYGCRHGDARCIPKVVKTMLVGETRQEAAKGGHLGLEVQCYRGDRVREYVVSVEEVTWPKPKSLDDAKREVMAKVRHLILVPPQSMSEARSKRSLRHKRP